ncbi:uL14 family ribosomal protein [Candidatus Micrarchaeota archaeon]|nr:uL14 family ribosomal protein [Candidatus Micrarchaeota archaeon]
MKGVAATISGGLTIGSVLKCDDNSGAKVLKILAKEGYRGRRGRIPKIGVAEIFLGSVREGKTDMRKKVLRAAVIRQRRPFRRHTGDRIAFEDNACVLLNDKNEPVASEIKGVVAKEVAERFPKVATIAKNVV